MADEVREPLWSEPVFHSCDRVTWYAIMSIMSELNPQPLPPRSVVSVYVPTKTLNDLEAMQKVTKDVLGKLGCPTCHSGRILEFRELERFVVNPDTLEVSPLGGGL
jgi:hypothetical protein